MRARRGLGAGLAAAVLLFAACGGGGGGSRGGLPSTFAYDRHRPLDFRDSGVVNRGYPIKVHDVSFASSRGGRVHAYLVVPPGKGPFPAVIWVHGSGVTRRDLLVEAVWFAARGSVGFVPDDPFERKPSLNDAVEGPLRAAIVQEVIDLRRSVDLLRSLPYVDGSRIGYSGLSLGARFGALLAGTEPRIEAFDLQSGRGGGLVTGLDELTWLARAHAHFFIQDGLHDEVIPRAQLKAFADAAPEPKTVRWYDAPHGLNSAAAHDLLRWLARELGLDGPVVRGALAGP